MSEQQRDVVAVLVHDHREVEDVFGKIEKLPSGDPRRKEYAEDAIIELVRHSVAEEQYLYPATRRLLDDGDAIADREIEEHSEAEVVMKQIEKRSADDPELDGLLERLMSDVRSHVEEEENELFPQLQQVASAEELRELGAQVERAKKVAPTRPHPSSPDTPPANKVLDPGAGLVDRVRDAVTGRGSS